MRHRRRIGHGDLGQRLRCELARNGGTRKQRDAEPAFHHLLGRLNVVELHHLAWRDPQTQEERLGQLVVARGPIEKDQPLRRDVGDPHPRALRERVIPRDNQDQRLLVKGNRFDVRVTERTDHRQLDFFSEEHLEHVLRMTGADGDLNPRVGGGETLQQRREHVGAHRGRRAEDQPAG